MNSDESNSDERMQERVRDAAELRRRLHGRRHGDSTQTVREGRRASSQSLAELELRLEDLLANVTEGNGHLEIDFGLPVGEEEW